MNLGEQEVKTLLTEVKALKSYATRIEAGLEKLLPSGVGTARKSQVKEKRKNEIRQEIKVSLLKH